MQTAAVTTGTSHIEITEVPVPDPAAGEALVRVEAVGICGTDLHIYDGSYAASLPIVQGHEISARVESLPDGYEGPLDIGDRVAIEPVIPCGTCYPCSRGRRNTCQSMDAIGVKRAGGFQQRVAVPVGNCHPVGDLPADVAALCETLSVSLRSVTRPDVAADDKVVVLGAGPIGLGAVIAALDRGAEVMAVDLHQPRLDLAGALGAAELVQGLGDLPDRVAAWTDGIGASVVIEATGVGRVAEAAFDIVANSGRISLVGVSEQTMTIGVRPFTGKELDVYGSRSTLDFPSAIALAQRQQASVERLISHRFRLEETGEAIAYALAQPQDVVKTLVEMSA